MVLGTKNFQLKSDRININELFKNKNLENLVIIYDYRIKEIDGIISCLMKAATRYRIKVNKPRKILLPKDNFYNNPKKAKDFVSDFDAKEV